MLKGFSLKVYQMSDVAKGVTTTWSDVWNLVKTPFVGDLDLLHLFMLVGIVIVFIVVWMMIFNTTFRIAQEV
jgi:hypothetical protein